MIKTILIMSKNNFAYRSKIVISYLQIAVSLLIQIAIWSAISKSGNIGMSQTEIVLYFIIIRLCLLFRNDIDGEVREHVKSGSIIYNLIRPLSLIRYYFITNTPKMLVNVFMYWLPLIIILFLMTSISIVNFIMFIVFMIMAYVFMMLYNFIFAVIIICIKNGDALYWGNVFVVTILSGSIIPINLLADRFSIVDKLPFKYIGYYPTSILLNKESLGSITNNIVIFGLWLIFIFLITVILDRTIIKNITIQGG